MPPRPLTDISTSGREFAGEYQTLTPRTPRSRSGFSESFTDIELERLDEEEEDDNENSSRSPLLPTHSNSNFRRQTQDKASQIGRIIIDAFNDWRKDLKLEVILARIPILVGGFIAAFMIYIVFVTYDSPDYLDRYFEQFYNKSIISYQNYSKFPLHPNEFLVECYKLHPITKPYARGYWYMEQNSLADVVHADEKPDYNRPAPRVCKTSITYMLGGDVGLLADLALMAQVAALARERRKSFFVDDTYWDRGKWTDHFLDVHKLQPGPQPGCRPPPPEELVACPRLARHWVVNSRTAKFHLGASFKDFYGNPYAHNLNRAKPIYNFAASSLSQTIRPNHELFNLIHAARTELVRTFPQSDSKHPKSSYTAIHIRRGDRKAVSREFHGDYVPVPNYIDSVTSTWKQIFPSPSPDMALPRVFLASDSPEAIHEFKQKFGHTTLFTIGNSSNPNLKALASPEPYDQQSFWNRSLEDRITATKGMIVDFALLSGAWAGKGDPKPEAVVCTFSSVVCKLAAVGLGWDQAFGKVDRTGRTDPNAMRWIEIDLKGSVVPVWEPFELF